MFVVPLKIVWEFRRKCASNVLVILLMVLNYVSNHTESGRGLQTKNERGLPARHRPPEADSGEAGGSPPGEFEYTRNEFEEIGIDLAEYG